MQARRLKSRAQFQAVLSAAKIARTDHFVMHRLILASSDASAETASDASELFAAGGIWLGAMIPKRWARRAVTRNLIKRQIYGLVKHRGADLPMAAYLIRLCRGFDSLLFRSAASSALRISVHSELDALFNKAEKIGVLS